MKKDKSVTAKDGGYASRKLWFALFTSAVILAASWVAPPVALGEVIMGLVAVCGLYITGNTVVRWKAGSIEQTKESAKSDKVEELEGDK